MSSHGQLLDIPEPPQEFTVVRRPPPEPPRPKAPGRKPAPPKPKKSKPKKSLPVMRGTVRRPVLLTMDPGCHTSPRDGCGVYARTACLALPSLSLVVSDAVPRLVLDAVPARQVALAGPRLSPRLTPARAAQDAASLIISHPPPLAPYDAVGRLSRVLYEALTFFSPQSRPQPSHAPRSLLAADASSRARLLTNPAPAFRAGDPLAPPRLALGQSAPRCSDPRSSQYISPVDLLTRLFGCAFAS
ncbi:hypothetical protein EV714DRAFT_277989 [Schizophyllum commune]